MTSPYSGSMTPAAPTSQVDVRLDALEAGLAALLYLDDLSTSEVAQIANIDTSVFTAARWTFLAGLAIDDYYTEDEVDALLTGYSVTTHDHNSSYYTETEVDAFTVKLTGNQTVAGTKTFSTIPVLPASDPTTANQATRKSYADSLMPPGTILPFAGISAPSRFLLCNGAAVSKTTYATLWAVLYSATRGTAGTGACTFADSGDLVTCAGHGFSTGDRVYFSSITSTTGISINTNYYVEYVGVDTFRLASSFANAVNGTYLALTTNGSGSIVYAPWGISGASNFLLPDGQGMAFKGVGTKAITSPITAESITYNGRLGHYNNDRIQGHYHDVLPDFEQFWVRDVLVSGQSIDTSEGSNHDVCTVVSTGAAVTDGTNGTPRSSTQTEMQTMGVNYIIKY